MKRLFFREETFFHSFVDMYSTESYPIFIPSGLLVRIVAVPFSRKKQDHGAGFYLLLFAGLGREVAASFRYIDKLVFLQDTSCLRFEVITVRMTG